MQVLINDTQSLRVRRGVAAVNGQEVREPLQRAAVNRIAAVQVRYEVILVCLFATDEERGDHGDSQSRAQVAYQVIESGSGPHQFVGQCFHGHCGERHKEKAIGETVHDVGPHHAAHAHRQVQVAQHKE